MGKIAQPSFKPKRRADRTVLRKRRYRGKLAANGQAVDVRFSLSARADCRLRFKFDALNGRSFLILAQTMGKAGQPSERLSLDAYTKSGDRITSDTLSLTGYRVNDDGHFIEVNYLTATVSQVMKDAAPKPMLRLWFRGFSSFRNSPTKTPLGTLAVWGSSDGSRADEMSGCVTLMAPIEAPGSNWVAEADQFLRHMHQGLAFAHGARLQTPRLDYVEGKTFNTTFFSGVGYQQEFSVQHFLNHDPFIAALVRRYFEEGPVPEVIWIGLRWMQTGTTVNEVRFLTAMTALETIIETVLPAKKGSTVPKSEFNALRDKLVEVVDKEDGLTGDQKEIFTERIKGINQKPLSAKIDALFDHYGMSRQDFGMDEIVSLVKLRNTLVHTGVLPDEIDIWDRIILVRELVTRILLSEIGFKGRYCCYIGGQHDRDFPETPQLP
ncbi:hypothetical protein Mesau_00733 [Mesorhizobium australicum WSM2073]|uniref:ApeA N-terminal domain-containing protein n=1 Tax=Mesorhizobium australicum (strain HAMBI 3006 / LMG 24608 / WSM2073) TaxID=754035 RepID=L0KFP8_MESAW|nr:HEPN domain-containing protein [Mesorhizobium australicum]AGB43219.1 hypothetical protein Mesau_00733 [Mesorhizobium australicum WSM2073]